MCQVVFWERTKQTPIWFCLAPTKSVTRQWLAYWGHRLLCSLRYLGLRTSPVPPSLDFYQGNFQGPLISHGQESS